MDRETFARQVDLCGQTLYRVARSLLRNEEDVRDALQEAVLKAWAALPRLREERYFSTWLTRIVMNECRNIQRRGARVFPAAEAGESVMPQETNDVMELVNALPEKQRLAVTLHYVEGLPLGEVARILRVPHSTVRGRLFEARKALRLELTAEEEASLQ